MRKEVSLALVENIAVGDYVIVHAGYALQKLDQEEAGQHKHVAQIRLRVGDWQAWYSISMIRIVGVPVHRPHHHRQLACGLCSGLPEASTCQ